jgi:hypothetical protein
MRTVLRAVLAAATTTAVTWLVERYLDKHRARKARLREALQNWENEGGAVAGPAAPRSA